jgi:putative thiamine transport system substrate-binding protein
MLWSTGPLQERVKKTVRKLLLAVASLAALACGARAADPDPADWNAVLADAKGETVYFNAWGGAENINGYIEWAGGELQKRYGVTLTQVKLDDTANAVAKVVAEKAAGRTEGGSVDLVWINGENFSAMKRQDLLLKGDWAEKLPNWKYVDTENKPTVLSDFTVPTGGEESPWGMAQLVFFHDEAKTSADDMPRSAAELLAWAQAHPGRFTYPQPPDFTGSSFLKQVLVELTPDPAVLARPADDASFAAAAAPLFDYLDRLHPALWRAGRAFPQNYPAMKQLLADGETDVIFAFNPAEASSAIAKGELPDTVRPFTFERGTLANTHFVAIPFNASAKAGALVAADFLLSPEAQARKQDPRYWGDPTVLSIEKLPDADQERFAALDLGIATPKPEDLGLALPEPHPSWMERLEAEWTRRYAAAR